MQEGKCTKNYPKRYNAETTVDEEGFLVYRRRDTGASFEKKWCSLRQLPCCSLEHEAFVVVQSTYKR